MRASKIKADTGEDADRGGDPDRCRGGEAAHREAFLDDHAGAEKADTGHDALRHARRVDLHTAGNRAHPVGLIDGDEHEQARRRAYERVRAKARRPAVVAPLVADESAGNERGHQSGKDLVVFDAHAAHILHAQ